MRELGAFYEQKQSEIHSYLRRHANSMASMADISRYIGLRKDEIEMIVDHDINLTREYRGDYIKTHSY